MSAIMKLCKLSLEKAAPLVQIVGGLDILLLSIVNIIGQFSTPPFCFGWFMVDLALILFGTAATLQGIRDFPFFTDRFGMFFTTWLRKGGAFFFLAWIYVDHGCVTNAFYIIFGIILIGLGTVCIISEYVGPFKPLAKLQLTGQTTSAEDDLSP